MIMLLIWLKVELKKPSWNSLAQNKANNEITSTLFHVVVELVQ